AQLGARVCLVERHGVGGAAVLTDVVPSKTLIATAEWMTTTDDTVELGIRGGAEGTSVDMAVVNRRVLELADRQSQDIRARLEREGVRIIDGVGRLVGGMRGDGTRLVQVRTADGEEELATEIVLVATGAHPRVLPDAEPDGERILTWAQLYELTEPPEHLVV